MHNGRELWKQRFSGAVYTEIMIFGPILSYIQCNEKSSFVQAKLFRLLCPLCHIKRYVSSWGKSPFALALPSDMQSIREGGLLDLV